MAMFMWDARSVISTWVDCARKIEVAVANAEHAGNRA